MVVVTQRADGAGQPTKPKVSARSFAVADFSADGVEPVVAVTRDEREELDELVVTVMAIPGRYRGMLARFGDIDEIDEVLRQRGDPMSWSALECISHVADVVHSLAKHTVAVIDGGDLSPPVPVDAPRGGSNGAPSRAVLAALHASVVDLARAAGTVSTGSSSVLVLGDDLVAKLIVVLEDACREAEAHLAEVETLLEVAMRRRRPSDGDDAGVAPTRDRRTADAVLRANREESDDGLGEEVVG